MHYGHNPFEAPLPGSDALLVLGDDGESIDVIDPSYVAPRPMSAGVQRYLRDRPPVRVYDVGAEERGSTTGLTLLGALGWVALILCAYVGYRLTHSGELAGAGFAPLVTRRLRYLPMVPVPTSNERQRTYRIACEMIDDASLHGSPYIDTRTGGRRVGAPFAVGGGLGQRCETVATHDARNRKIAETSEWYYAVALDCTFVDAPDKKAGDWEFDSLEGAMSRAQTLRDDVGEEITVSVHPYRRAGARS